MGVFRHIDAMRSFVVAGDWRGLERCYEQLCCEQAGTELAKRIASVSLKIFQAALAPGLSEAIRSAESIEAKAVYFEYDMDNDWESAFFVCPKYRPESEGDDDWACDYSEAVEGPDLPEFGAIYREYGFSEKPAAVGSTCYMIARTVAAVGRAAGEIPGKGLAICAGFHDQDPIVRIHEAK